MKIEVKFHVKGVIRRAIAHKYGIPAKRVTEQMIKDEIRASWLCHSSTLVKRHQLSIVGLPEKQLPRPKHDCPE